MRSEFSVFPHSATETKIDFPRLVLESFGAGTSKAFAAFATIDETDFRGNVLELAVLQFTILIFVSF